MIKYKKDIVAMLKEYGYSTYTIKQTKVFSEGTMQKFRNNDTSITLDTIDKLCSLLDCYIEDIIEYVPDTKIDNKNSL